MNLLSRLIARCLQRPSPAPVSRVEQKSRPGANNANLVLAKSQGLSQADSDTVDGVGKSAAAGDATAQNSIGLMFASGEGVLKNVLEAREWFRRAAHQGDAVAQFNLGNLCHPASLSPLLGGVPEARIESYMWFNLAAAQGHSRAEASCEMLNLQMTDAELHEGNRRVNAFQPKKETSS
jgi:TPR repeat protein